MGFSFSNAQISGEKFYCYGIDYSYVKVFGAKESPLQFEEAFKEINTFAVGDIPDVKNCNTKYEQAIYKFYRAGIVIGNNAGEFMPDNTISRAEVATILVRMMDSSFRSKK